MFSAYISNLCISESREIARESAVFVPQLQVIISSFLFFVTRSRQPAYVGGATWLISLNNMMQYPCSKNATVLTQSFPRIRDTQFSCAMVNMSFLPVEWNTAHSTRLLSLALDLCDTLNQLHVRGKYNIQIHKSHVSVCLAVFIHSVRRFFTDRSEHCEQLNSF